MQSVTRLPAWAAALVLLAACGGGGTDNSPVPKTLQLVSGDGQSGTVGLALPQPLVVRVLNSAGAAAQGVTVSLAVIAGGGTLSSASVVTDAQGLAAVTWTLGPAAGTGNNRAAASVTGLTGSPVTFTASGTAAATVVVTRLAPDTLVQGSTATITGTGFAATPAGNLVTIGGVAAPVTAATATSLVVTVPRVCRPVQPLPVTVTVGSAASTAVAIPVRPAALDTIALGAELIAHDPANLCVQLAGSAGMERYLVGVQSVSDVAGSITPAILRTDIAPAPPTTVSPTGALPLPSEPAFGTIAMAPSPSALRWQRQREAELGLRTREAARLRSPAALHGAAAGLGRAPAFIPSGLSVGDTVPLKFPDIASSDFCSNSVPILTVVKAIGTHSIWLADTQNPVGGYAASDFQSLSGELDTWIYPVDTATFGGPTDLDGNDRIAVVITRQLNLKNANLLGFVVSSDLAPTSDCPASNVGEVFYGRAPDSSNVTGGGAYTTAQALADAPFLIAHEFTHIIQFGRRIQASATTFPSIWEAEGQATLAEEVVGNAVESRTTAQNLGFGVAFNLDDPSSTDWYSDRFVDLALYFGFKDNASQVPGAPEQCGWLAAQPAAGPCIGNRQVYGVPWSLLRWLSDHYGAGLPGGEAQFQKALIDTDGQGFSHIAAITGLPIDSLLPEWAAALYVDDRYAGMDPSLSFPSWNLFDVYYGNFAGLALYPSTRLTPRSHNFAPFSQLLSVRAGSSSYDLVGGTSHGPVAVGATGNGAPLPASARLWIVRVQ